MTSMTDSPTRAAFAARFGEDQAEALTRAATGHDNDAHPNRGTDPFRWVLAICIGYECFSVEGYRKYHAITAPADEVRAWIKASADMRSHDGDVDYLALFAGAYDDFIADEVSS